MSEKISEEEAIAMITRVINEEQQVLVRDTELVAIDSWDSMGILLLMSELDERFSIEVTEDQVTKIKTIGDIIDFMAEHGAIA